MQKLTDFSVKHKSFFMKLFIVFMILQPIFDIYYLYTEDIINIFKFSPSTIIRMLIMGILVVVAFLIWKGKHKYRDVIILSVIYFAYIVLHHLTSSAFYVPYGNFDHYSILNELFYMIRMMMPLLLIFVTYQFKIKWENVQKVVVIVCLIFSVVMVLTNIFGISLTSYYDGNKIIKHTIFDWFNSGIYNNGGYILVASKGIFHMANQVSGVLICLLPILIYIFFKKPNVLHTVTLILTILSMIMLGTRVASMGWAAVAIVMLVIYLFFVFAKKEMKFNLKMLIIYGIILICFGALLPFSPVMNRIYINDNSEEVEEEIESMSADKLLKNFLKKMEEKEKTAKNEDDLEEIKEEKAQFLFDSYVTFGVDKQYIMDLYPYDEDVDFWLSEYQIPFKDRANHRQLKTDITKRIIELNDNKADYLFGMSFTRLRNAQVYMENDIYVHLYSIGIFGILLLICPYIAILFIGIYQVFRHYKEKFTFENIIYLFSICLVIIAGVVSGNVFDEWIVTLFLGFICGMLLLNLFDNKKEKNE